MSRARIAKKKRTTKTPQKQPETRNDKRWLQEAIDWLLATSMFRNCKLHGNTTWTPFALCVQALLWVWSSEECLTGAFKQAKSQSQKLIGTVAVKTFQGLAAALLTWTPTFMVELQVQFHELIAEIGGTHFRMGRWLAIAADGSRSTTPRSRSNEKAFCARNYGKGQTAKYRKKKTKGMRRRQNKKNKPQPPAPQIWITLMWHMGMGVPWCWKLGPSNSSERQHVMDLLEVGHFAKDTLFVADAGFVGYDFWNAILKQGHHFLVRVGANVRLLQDLGYRTEKKNGIVYCWPQEARRMQLPPLKLRLVECLVGKKKMSLLTSVLDREELTHKEIEKLYKRRWGVELEFRCLKQTFDRRKLRSKNSERALVEMEWSVLGMAVIELFALKEQLRRPQADPHQLSFAQSLDAIRTSLQQLGDPDPDTPDIQTALRGAKIDGYERKAAKSARYKANTKTKPSCGHPIITIATIEQRNSFKHLHLQHAT